MPVFRFGRLLLAAGLALATTLPTMAQDRGFSGSYLAARHAASYSDYINAAEYFTRALARDPSNPALLENAMLANIGIGQIDRAVPLAKRALDLGIESQIAQMVVMADLLERDSYDTVLRNIQEGKTVGPLVDGLITAWAQLAKGQVAEAEAAFDETITSTGLKPMGLFHKALAFASVGNFAAAEKIFSGESDGPLRLTPRGVRGYAQVLSQLDRNDDALELIASTFGDAENPAIRALAARLRAGEKVPFTLIRSGKDGAAEVFYTVARALSGEASDGYTLLYARIAEHLREGGHTDAILLSAALLESLERYELATATYKSVSRDDPAYPTAELGRAETLRSADKVDAAIEVLTALAETHGEFATVHVTLGDTLRREERFDEATAAYDRGLERLGPEAPGHWVVYFARGITHEREDRWPQAEADFRKALELSPNQPRVLNYLGYSFVEMNENLDEALDMIERAVAARPDDGYIVDSLGWVLYRLGRYEESVGHMESAASLRPIDPIINDHLGDVYWAVGRTLEAEFQWRRALSFEPEEKDAARIRRKIEIGLDRVLEEEGAPPLKLANDDG